MSLFQCVLPAAILRACDFVGMGRVARTFRRVGSMQYLKVESREGVLLTAPLALRVKAWCGTYIARGAKHTPDNNRRTVFTARGFAGRPNARSRTLIVNSSP